jgi:hypothetical protein
MSEYCDPIPTLSQEDVRYFFAKREWLRPKEYDDMANRKAIDPARLRELACFAYGWMCAKDQWKGRCQ